MKSALPWILVVGLFAVLVWQVQSNLSKTSELSALPVIKEQLAALQTEAEQNETARANMEMELKQLRSDAVDVLRLRNEVRQLRVQNDQLSKQMSNTEVELRNAQSQARNLQTAASLAQNQALVSSQQQQQQAAAMDRFRKRYGLEPATGDPNVPAGPIPPEQAQANSCIANLRQIDAAKQLWASDANHPAGATPSATDLAPYLKDNAMPGCPGGGTYNLNAVGAAATCSMPGHSVSR